jgi:hypothetical protein
MGRPQGRVLPALLAALLLGLGLLPDAARAQEPFGTFVLTVRDRNRAPVPRATVGIVRNGVTDHIRVDDGGVSRFSFPSAVPDDFCSGYEHVSPAHPLSCARSIVVGPGLTREVELVVHVLPFEPWVSPFADPDWTRGFTPFWVQTHAPGVVLWSGPDEGAVVFGARGQWSHFLVAGPQVGTRLYVFDNASKNFAWVDAEAVGPSGPPPIPVTFPAARP